MFNFNRGNYFEDVSVQRLSELKKFTTELRNILISLKDTLFTESNNFKSNRLKMLVGNITDTDNWLRCEKGIHVNCMDTLNKIESKVLWVGKSNSLPTPVIGICPAYDKIIEDIEKWDLKAI